MYLQNNRAIKELFLILLLVTSMVIFATGLIIQEEKWFFWAVIIEWIYMFLKNLRRDRFTVLSFVLTFFAFLMGTLVIRYFDSTVELRYSTQLAKNHTLICLYIALLFVDIGTLIAKRVNFKTPDLGIQNKEKIYRIQIASKLLYFFTSIFSILIAAEKILYVITSGSYTSYFVNFSSVFPSFFTKFADMNEFAFFIFLSTLPDPRKDKAPFVIYFIIGVMGLLYGQRNQIVMAIIMLWIYFILYENYKDEKYSIIKRKYYAIAIIAAPFVMFFLEYFMYLRDSINYSYNGIGASVKHFISSLGGSVNVIGQGYELKDSFPKGHFYSLGGVIDFLTKNELVRPLLGTTVYKDNTIEMALQGNSYGQTITYLGWGSSVYLSGRGMGSSFIAEAFHDMGYIGVMLFSTIYGVILTVANNLKEGKFFKNAIILISLHAIIYAPRDSAGSFISAYFNFSFIFTCLAIYILSTAIKLKRKEFTLVKG